MSTKPHRTIPTPAWRGHWIARGDQVQGNYKAEVKPAPWFRREFTLAKVPKRAVLRICGVGWYEVHINGSKVGDHVLDPGVTQYDRRLRYVTYDVTPLLRTGANAIGVVLGNGWYNTHTSDTWHFDKVSWRDMPKVVADLLVDGRPAVATDSEWRFANGPIIFDGLRDGEHYDARLELAGWSEPGLDAAAWKPVRLCAPPGGMLEPQTMQPCKVMQTLPVAQQWAATGGTVYDFAQNLSGWARLAVSGEAGAEVVIRYGEVLADDRSLDQSHIRKHVESKEFQTDRYILRGGGVETWEPRFTFHGFRYAQVTITGKAVVRTIEARVVHTAFASIGSLTTSDPMINRLQECTRWSYIGNFVGIPTDCPHREKNGWTGDAQLAAETGLMNYDAGPALSQWMDSFADVQRPSGQLPGIVPSGGWGFNWGSGPAWDSAFILIPWYIHLHTGDLGAVERHYEGMRRYVDYCTSMAVDGIVSFGLGDWCHVDWSRITSTALTSTSYYYVDALILSRLAGLTGRKADQKKYAALAAGIRKAFNRAFYRGKGIYAKGEQTALACALYQGLVEESQRKLVVAQLVKAVEANQAKVDFGILGAKWVPRALAANGHVDLAWKIISQPEFPGWIDWIKRGATTLWEDWKGANSLNHIMFGDVSAWMYNYLGGIMPDERAPGFAKPVIRPHPVPGLESFACEHRAPAGRIATAWRVADGMFSLEVTLPPGTVASVVLPDGTTKTGVRGAGNRFTCPLRPTSGRRRG